MRINYSINLHKVIYRVSVEHLVSTVFATKGDARFEGTKGARRGLMKAVRTALRDQQAKRGNIVTQRFIANHPRWPGIRWAHIEKDVKKAIRQYENDHSPDAYAREQLEQELFEQQAVTTPKELHDEHPHY